METLYVSNIDIYYSDTTTWVNASLSTVGFGDTGVNAFLQFTIPAATVPTGQRVKSAILYVKNSGSNQTFTCYAVVSGSYRDTTVPSTGVDTALLQSEVFSGIDITDVYADFAGIESTVYLNLDATEASRLIYTHNSGSIPYLVVEYETAGSVIQYDDGTDFADKAIYHDDGSNFTRMNAYYDNGTDFVLMG